MEGLAPKELPTFMLLPSLLAPLLLLFTAPPPARTTIPPRAAPTAGSGPMGELDGIGLRRRGFKPPLGEVGRLFAPLPGPLPALPIGRANSLPNTAVAE